MKVLIADDDPTTLLALGAALRKQGFHVETAADAMQAVMKAVRVEPDAILLDIQMPGGNGLTALRRIKQSSKTATIPVIAITGTPTPELREEVVGLGAVDCMGKPVDVEALVATLEAEVGP